MTDDTRGSGDAGVRVNFVAGTRVNEIPCDYCGAAIGQPCTTSTGRVALSPHAGRAKRSARLDGQAFDKVQSRIARGIQAKNLARVDEMKRLYGPRWRYMTPEYRDPRDDAARKAAERTMRRWPDGDPVDQRPGEWWCCCPDGAPMERRMYLGKPYDPYHGPVLAVIIDTGQRFRWEVAYNGPRVAGDPFDVTFDAGYSDTLADARASAEDAAWEYITESWPDKAKAVRAWIGTTGEESPGRST